VVEVDLLAKGLLVVFFDLDINFISDIFLELDYLELLFHFVDHAIMVQVVPRTISRWIFGRVKQQNV